jgi:serine/threonine-protein kinase HipA
VSERIRRLALHIGGQVQGEVTVAAVGGGEQWSFTYQATATQDAALTMPRRIPTYVWDGILPAFEQHLPEMDLGLFPAAIWKRITRDHAGMLWVAGQRRLGRLRFTRPDERPPEIAALDLSERDIANTTDGDGLLADLLSRMTQLPGVSGVQPKLLLPLLDAAAEPPRVLADTHLLKGNRPEYAYATTVEAATLDLAEAFGLPVPPRTLSADGRLLAVRRFDLDADGEPRGFDEAASLMGLWARDKYNGSNESLHRSLRAFIAPTKRHAFTRALFALLAFNLAVENGDAHLKNFGVLYDDPDDAELAPVYDVLTTTCFDGMARDTPALTLGGRRVWDDWSGFERFALQCGLRTATVRQLLSELADTLHRQRQRRLPQHYAERVPAAAPILQRVDAAWQRGLARLQAHLRTD